MATSPLPALFVSHGAPMLAVEDAAARRFFQDLGRALGRPGAILAVSGHWETRERPAFSLSPTPETIHDFRGFPDALYRLRYPAPGAPALAERATALLAAAGKPADLVPERGLDHGAWVPLMLMYPDADIPVTQMSLVRGATAAEHLALGRALEPLRHEGVLILGSGAATHNLRALDWGGTPAPAPWATAFIDWLDGALAAPAGEVADWLAQAPTARQSHPTDDHFLPLPVALGAAGPTARATRVHASWQYGNLGMHAWAFAAQGEPAYLDAA